jgi:hypothetical protein
LGETVKIWDAITGLELLTLKGHQSSVDSGLESGLEMVVHREFGPDSEGVGRNTYAGTYDPEGLQRFCEFRCLERKREVAGHGEQ